MIYIIIIVLIFIIDQVTKNYIDKNYKLGETKEIVKDKFYFSNFRNYGAAFGFLKDKPKILKIINITAISFLLYYLADFLKNKTSVLDKLAISFAVGGALGNIYDRFRKKFVTDFLYIKFKNAPIFNIADIFILLGALIYIFKNIFDLKISK